MPAQSPPRPRLVEVPAERLPRWLAQFGSRHGEPQVASAANGWSLTCPDGAIAEVENRWGEPPESSELDAITHHLTRGRRLGLVLVRKGGHAVGISHDATLVASKVDSSYVQGRTKAGGWSQQRFARRREGQATKAYQSAAGTVATVLLPQLESLDALVCGGDSRAIDQVLADARLVGLLPLRVGAVLPTTDPRLAVLHEFVSQARATRMWLNELA